MGEKFTKFKAAPVFTVQQVIYYSKQFRISSKEGGTLSKSLFQLEI